VTFVEDGTVLGGPVEVADGKASFSTSDLVEGTHSIVATFTPTDTEAYQPSTSEALTLVVGTPTTTTSVPDLLTPGGTDVGGIGSLPVTGVGVGAAGVGLILVYVGRVLYLVGRPRTPAPRG
jgi:hypothetical protein